jgi:hyperosmotically inducible protein
MNSKYLIPAASLAVLMATGSFAMAAGSTEEKPKSASVSAAISDTATTAKVKTKFMEDTRLKDTDISVSTANGIVTLTGTAQTSEAKNAAEEISTHVEGVKSVDNQIMTPSVASQIGKETKAAAKKTGQVTSDSWITTKVKSSLLADSVTKGFQISVKTTNGVVTLSGTVATQSAIDQAEHVAKQIKGVTDVDTSALKVSTKS